MKRFLTDEDILKIDRHSKLLIQVFARGDMKSFEQLYDYHHAYVRALVGKYIGRRDRNRVDDVTQDAWIAVIRNAHRYQPRPDVRFTTWLTTVVRNVCFMNVRAFRRRPDQAQVEDSNLVVDEKQRPVPTLVEESHIRQIVKDVLATLPFEVARAFWLHHFVAMTFEEVAEETNAPVGTVKSRVWQGEAAVRPYLEKYARNLTKKPWEK